MVPCQGVMVLDRPHFLTKSGNTMKTNTQVINYCHQTLNSLKQSHRTRCISRHLSMLTSQIPQDHPTLVIQL